MRKYLIFALPLLMACSTPKSNEIVIKEGYVIKTIDLCEYIEVSFAIGLENSHYSLTHKGNCKYCINRKKYESQN